MNPRSGRHTTLVASFVVALVIALFFVFRVLLEDDPPAPRGDDLDGYFHPVYDFAAASLRSGVVPLWNPYQLCGLPTLGTLQGGFLYPLHAIYLVLPIGMGMAISAWLHLALLGVSIVVLARRLGLGLGPAVLGGVLAASRGWHVGQIGSPSVLEAEAWLGIGLIAAVDLSRGRRFGPVALLGLATGMSLLAGYPQQTVYACYACAGFAGLLLVIERPPWRIWRSAALGLFAGVGLGALLGAVQLLPALELAEAGVRARGVLPLELMYPRGFATSPELWRHVVESLEQRVPAPPLALSFGIVSLVLALPALLWRGARSAAIAALVLGVLAIGFGIGPVTPLFDLYLALPELGSFRQPNRVLYLADVFVALLAAIGLEAIVRLRELPSAAARVAAPLLVVGAGGLVLVTVPHVSVSAPWLVAGIAAAAAFGAWRSEDWAASAAVAGCIALATFELFSTPTRFPRLPYGIGDHHAPRHIEDVALFDRLAEQPGRTWIWSPTTRTPDKVGTGYRFGVVSDYEPVLLARQSEYFSMFMAGSLESSRARSDGQRNRKSFQGQLRPASKMAGEGLAGRQRLIDLAGARWILATESQLAEPWVERLANSHPLVPVAMPTTVRGKGGALRVFENRRALPRTYVARSVRPAPPVPSLLRRLASDDFDPRLLSFVEADLVLPESGASSAQQAHSRIVSESLHEVEIEAQLDAEALVVLADTFYPGWEATVDGQPATIFATNHLFRGVRVDAGTHRVVFRYRPASVGLGALASALGVVLLAVSVARARREPSTRPDADPARDQAVEDRPE